MECLQALDLSWNQIKNKGILTVYRGKKKHEHFVPMLLMRRVFANKITMLHFIKNIEYLLDSDKKSNF